MALFTLGDVYATTAAPTDSGYVWIIGTGTPGSSYMLCRNSTDRRYPDAEADPFDTMPHDMLINNNDTSASINSMTTLTASTDGIMSYGPIRSTTANFLPGNGFVFTDPEDPAGQPVWWQHFPADTTKGDDGYSTAHRVGGGFYVEFTTGAYVEESYVTVGGLVVTGDASTRTLTWDTGTKVTSLGTMAYRVRRATVPGFALYGWSLSGGVETANGDISGWISGTSFVDSTLLTANRWYVVEARIDLGPVSGVYRYIGQTGRPPTAAVPSTVNVGNYTNAVLFDLAAVPVLHEAWGTIAQ